MDWIRCSILWINYFPGLFLEYWFNPTFNNISIILWRSVLLVEEVGVPRENHRPVTSHWQTLSHNVVLFVLCFYMKRSNQMSVLWFLFTSTYAISAYQHWCCEFESRSGRGVIRKCIHNYHCTWLRTCLALNSDTLQLITKLRILYW
jgi:hypothetical protein